jgi:hypothetical protein
VANVAYTDAVIAQLQTWAAVAAQIGWQNAYATALREMHDRLRTDPEAWGDPIKDYRAMRLTLYKRYGPILIVTYAVHIDGTPVFVQGVDLTPGTLLDLAAG